MRKVVVYELLSLDGVAEDPDAFIDEWDEVMSTNLADVIARQDAVILGHRNHDEWARFWPASDIEPFATFINAVPKYVAARSPLQEGWTNVRVMEGELADAVRDLKQQDGGDIGVHGSIMVAQALLGAGLVDELQLVVSPRIAGSGRRLLDGLPSLRLETVKTTTSPTGSLLLHYRMLA